MFHKSINVIIIITFLCSLVTPLPKAQAQSLLGLPQPGNMVNLSPAFQPVLIKGIKVHPENPFLFDFVLDVGNSGLRAGDIRLKEESTKLIKYFLASLTIPEKNLWVNLSPYEKDRMIDPDLGQTEMGRDMLAQDYILKQLTASLIYPEKNLGKEFWQRVYEQARKQFGTSQIPVNTFNKVWIVADRADVFQRNNVAYVAGAHLKVMLEEDYFSLQKHTVILIAAKDFKTSSVASQIVKEIILPQLEREVNTARNFANLRQMFYSMILASWYKTALKNAVLTRYYGNQNKVRAGINQNDPRVNEQIFNRYLQAYKKGVFNYIKETDAPNGISAPRKYFSGGEAIWQSIRPRVVDEIDPAMLGDSDVVVQAGVYYPSALLGEELSKESAIFFSVNGKSYYLLLKKYGRGDSRTLTASLWGYSVIGIPKKLLEIVVNHSKGEITNIVNGAEHSKKEIEKGLISLLEAPEVDLRRIQEYIFTALDAFKTNAPEEVLGSPVRDVTSHEPSSVARSKIPEQVRSEAPDVADITAQAFGGRSIFLLVGHVTLGKNFRKDLENRGFGFVTARNEKDGFSMLMQHQKEVVSVIADAKAGSRLYVRQLKSHNTSIAPTYIWSLLSSSDYWKTQIGKIKNQYATRDRPGALAMIRGFTKYKERDLLTNLQDWYARFDSIEGNSVPSKSIPTVKAETVERRTRPVDLVLHVTPDEIGGRNYILLVGDKRGISPGAVRRLRDNDFSVIKITNSDKAWEYIKENVRNIAAVVVDVSDTCFNLLKLVAESSKKTLPPAELIHLPFFIQVPDEFSRSLVEGRISDMRSGYTSRYFPLIRIHGTDSDGQDFLKSLDMNLLRDSINLRSDNQGIQGGAVAPVTADVTPQEDAVNINTNRNIVLLVGGIRIPEAVRKILEEKGFILEKVDTFVRDLENFEGRIALVVVEYDRFLDFKRTHEGIVKQQPVIIVTESSNQDINNRLSKYINSFNSPHKPAIFFHAYREVLLRTIDQVIISMGGVARSESTVVIPSGPLPVAAAEEIKVEQAPTELVEPPAPSSVVRPIIAIAQPAGEATPPAVISQKPPMSAKLRRILEQQNQPLTSDLTPKQGRDTILLVDGENIPIKVKRALEKNGFVFQEATSGGNLDGFNGKIAFIISGYEAGLAFIRSHPKMIDQQPMFILTGLTENSDEGRPVFRVIRKLNPNSKVNFCPIHTINDEGDFLLRRIAQVVEQWDYAQMAETTNGGIDLNSNKMRLNIKNDDGIAIKFNIDPAILQQLQDAPGLIPVIFNIKPMTDLRAFLGI